MFPYHNLGTKPVFATTINSKRKSRWNRIFGGGKSGGDCGGYKTSHSGTIMS